MIRKSAGSSLDPEKLVTRPRPVLDNDTKIETLRMLLRAERTAVSTYEKVLGKTTAEHQRVIRQILEGHQNAGKQLLEQLERMGAAPEKRELAEDSLAALISGPQDPFLFKALKVREKELALNYQNTLELKDLDESLFQLIQKKLLPRVQSTLPVINQMLEES